MSADHVQSEILEPMQRLFLPPRQMPAEDQSAALREYVAALKVFDREDLAAAWCAVRDAHTTRGWPVPSSFVLAARQARTYRLKAAAPANAAAKTDQPANARWELWKAVSRSAMARDAARLGVAWTLRSAILDGKAPEQIDLREFVRAKRRAQETADRLQRGDLNMRPDLTELAGKMWRTLQVREAQAQSEINFGTAA